MCGVHPCVYACVLSCDYYITIDSVCSFKWYKDTQELEYCKTPVLVIPKAVYNDSGQYCCSVSNKHGSRLSGSFHIRVTRTQGWYICLTIYQILYTRYSINLYSLLLCINFCGWKLIYHNDRHLMLLG